MLASDWFKSRLRESVAEEREKVETALRTELETEKKLREEMVAEKTKEQEMASERTKEMQEKKSGKKVDYRYRTSFAFQYHFLHSSFLKIFFSYAKVKKRPAEEL